VTDPTRDTGQAAEPGAVSRLLAEIARASEDHLAGSWREPLKPGDAVGRYQIRREIGRGGFGAVYEAFDPQLGRTVALKALKPGRSKHPVSEEWIQKEAEAVAKLDHPAIVTIFDVGTCPAGAYLVMELLRGETLARRIEKGPMPVDEALRVAEQMAEGLAHAHSRGVLHRDLKPANVFVCEDGRVKLLDFGLAHLLGTEGSSGAGTPAYMAPEQAAGAAVDERADVWAAGMVLGEMLTGKRPVERTPSPEPGAASAAPKTELIWEAPKESPRPAAATPGPRFAGVPRPVAKVMAAALAEDPEARPRDGSSWLSELRSARLRVDRPRRTRRVAILGGVGLVVGLAVAGLATWRVWERQIPGGRPTVAVADFANETGDKDLDGISGLLTTSLEQGTQLRVLTRGRMVDVLKQLGKGTVERIDEPLAREVGRETRANALLLASIRKLGNAYVVEMRALDPLHDEYIFTVSDRATGKEAVFELVDRLGAATRRKLGAAEGAGGAPVPRVASITTANPRAWDLLSQARQAIDKGEYGRLKDLVAEALKEDPEFALAHVLAAELAVDRDKGTPEQEAEARAHLDAADRFVERLPEKDRLTLRALRAQVDGDWNEARRVLVELAEAYPLDKVALYQAGDILIRTGRPDLAIGYLERAVALDPSSAPVADTFVDAVVDSGQADRHVATLRRLASAGTRPAVVSRGLLAAGQEKEALEMYREANRRRVAAGKGEWPNWQYVLFLASRGRDAEAEALMRSDLERNRDTWKPGSGAHRVASTNLSFSLARQGRAVEALRVIAEGGSLEPPTMSKPYLSDFLQQHIHSTVGLADKVQALAETILRYPDATSPGNALIGISILAETGRLLEASRLAAEARQRLGARWEASREGGRGGGPLGASERYIDVMVALGRRDDAAADRLLQSMADDPLASLRASAHFIRGELARERGDCATAVPHLEFLREAGPSAVDLSQRRPFLLQALAACYEELGDLPKARDRNDELLRLWVNADPDLPWLIEAKARRERLRVSPK
jgi:tetratricopeptide (TPR) repeat protein